ncbi:MAG TPA: glycosyltransferase family 4 protein [Limnobacter sp.]|uniref:glycosyltransferase family 4 protein n=1 Tax=Limnobacter sp. TaxID=2003368 RepID=UPI002ED8BFC3
MPAHKPKIAFITTTILQVKFFLVPHLNALAERYDVTLILKEDYPEIRNSLPLKTNIHFIDIERAVSPVKDLKGLWQLYRYLRSQRFDMVHTVNPKAGLLGILAAFLARVPIRLHTFQGEIWANKTGVWRAILRFMDRLVGWCATDLTVVSHSERDVLVREGLISARKSTVLANGSIGGVDMVRFSPKPSVRQAQRSQLGFGPQHTVFLYLGRLNVDKGLLELAQAFSQVHAQRPTARLLLVGLDEEQILEKIQPWSATMADALVYRPYTPAPEDILQAADVLVLPSHREGFGVVIIEAAALGIPSIGSRIYGISDALVDGQTGLMFEKGNADDLAKAITTLIDQPERMKAFGHQARLRVEAEFQQSVVLEAFLAHYARLLKRVQA